MVELVAVVATLALIALRELVRHVVWKTTKQLVLAVVAANVASYVLAAAVAFGMFAAHGTTTGYRTIVADTLPGYDAAAKLQSGDAILAVDHEPLDSGASLTGRVARKNGEAVTLTIERAGATSDVTVTPTRSTEGGTQRWLLGIQRSVEPIQATDLGAAFRKAAVYPAAYVRSLARQVVELFAGSEHADAGGPMRIVDEFRVALQSFLVRMGQRLMQFAVLAMLLMFVIDVIRVIRLARLART